jgi:hypothetical protein
MSLKRDPTAYGPRHAIGSAEVCALITEKRTEEREEVRRKQNPIKNLNFLCTADVQLRAISRGFHAEVAE